MARHAKEVHLAGLGVVQHQPQADGPEHGLGDAQQSGDAAAVFVLDADPGHGACV